MMAMQQSNDVFKQDAYKPQPEYERCLRDHIISRHHVQEPRSPLSISKLPPRVGIAPHIAIYAFETRSATSFYPDLQIPRQDHPVSTWLPEALEELEDLSNEIIEDDLPEIRTETKNEAKRIVQILREHPIAPTIYPTDDGEVVIHFKSPAVPAAVVLELSNNGQGACFSYVNGKSRRARYDDSSDLPDEFVKAQLEALVTATSGT